MAEISKQATSGEQGSGRARKNAKVHEPQIKQTSGNQGIFIVNLIVYAQCEKRSVRW